MTDVVEANPPEISFYVLRPAWWTRHLVFFKAGGQSEIIARFWSWDKADDLVDKLARVTMPAWSSRLAEMESERDRALSRAEHSESLLDFRRSMYERATARYRQAEYDVGELLTERQVWKLVVDVIRRLHKPVLETVEWFHDQNGRGEALVCSSCHSASPTEWHPPEGEAGVQPEGFVPSYVLSPCHTLAAVDIFSPADQPTTEGDSHG